MPYKPLGLLAHSIACGKKVCDDSPQFFIALTSHLERIWLIRTRTFVSGTNWIVDLKDKVAFQIHKKITFDSKTGKNLESAELAGTQPQWMMSKSTERRRQWTWPPVADTWTPARVNMATTASKFPMPPRQARSLPHPKCVATMQVWLQMTPQQGKQFAVSIIGGFPNLHSFVNNFVWITSMQFWTIKLSDSRAPFGVRFKSDSCESLGDKGDGDDAAVTQDGFKLSYNLKAC